ncbi:MAG TPA: hypothetical protein VGY77_06620 [Gemmataceae bacterium]|nr:hypothetical protein [Gemmataceae bacterium]
MKKLFALLVIFGLVGVGCGPSSTATGTKKDTPPKSEAKDTKKDEIVMPKDKKDDKKDEKKDDKKDDK